jgi:uncharacterized phage protein (TIGR01671 family)
MIPKFRAWLKEENKMIIVDTMNWFDDEFESIGDGITFLRGAEKIELMQSTGLKDKNGKEVFVGDIIKCTRGCPHEVYLEKEYGGTYIGGMPAIYLKGIREGYAWTGVEEIIGNVYENPDLLEVKS